MDKKTWRGQTNWEGHYPAVLTTDGFGYAVEFRNNYDGWRPNDIAIAWLDNSDSLPSFSECERRRRAVRQKTKQKWGK